jgi:hypothetical protein
MTDSEKLILELSELPEKSYFRRGWDRCVFCSSNITNDEEHHISCIYKRILFEAERIKNEL